MQFENKEITCRFTVPDKPTVRQQMKYFEPISFPAIDSSLWEQNWSAALTLIDDWECEYLPDRFANLDEMTDPKQATAIIWASSQVRGFINKLDEVPKN